MSKSPVQTIIIIALGIALGWLLIKVLGLMFKLVIPILIIALVVYFLIPKRRDHRS